MKIYTTLLPFLGSFVLLKYWLPPSIEVPQIWPNEKAINNNELVQIIRHVNKEVRAFHSRSEQLKELEVQHINILISLLDYYIFVIFL